MNKGLLGRATRLVNRLRRVYSGGPVGRLVDTPAGQRPVDPRYPVGRRDQWGKRLVRRERCPARARIGRPMRR